MTHQKNDIQDFLTENIVNIINDSYSQFIRIKEISDELKKRYPEQDHWWFEPRRIGHHVRQMGHAPYKTRRGYVIMKK